MIDSEMGKRARLWIVSELYYPEQTSTGYFLTRIAEGLVDTYDVRVMCGQPSYSERGMKAPRYEVRHGATLYRMRATHFDKDKLLLRAVNMVTLTVAMFFFALWHFKHGDRVIAVTNPPSVPIVIGLVAKWRRMRSILLVHDVYPEVLVASDILRANSFGYRLLYRLFSATYALFSEAVVLGADMAEIVARKLGSKTRPIHVIPNWGDTDEIAPIDRAENAFRSEHALAGKFVVQFSGNIGRTHDIELILKAAAMLRNRTDIVFLFVGYGGKTGLLEGAGEAERSNLRYLPRQPRARLAEMLAASDVTVISFVDGMYGLSVPSRMYNVMAAGVPIIAVADPRSELARTVAHHEAGWVLVPRTEGELAALIVQLASADGLQETARRGRSGRQSVEQHYVLPIILDVYRKILT